MTRTIFARRGRILSARAGVRAGPCRGKVAYIVHPLPICRGQVHQAGNLWVQKVDIGCVDL